MMIHVIIILLKNNKNNNDNNTTSNNQNNNNNSLSFSYSFLQQTCLPCQTYANAHCSGAPIQSSVAASTCLSALNGETTMRDEQTKQQQKATKKKEKRMHNKNQTYIYMCYTPPHHTTHTPHRVKTRKPTALKTRKPTALLTFLFFPGGGFVCESLSDSVTFYSNCTGGLVRSFSIIIGAFIRRILLILFVFSALFPFPLLHRFFFLMLFITVGMYRLSLSIFHSCSHRPDILDASQLHMLCQDQCGLC